MAVHSQGLSGVADILLQSQRTSTDSCPAVRTPGTVLQLGSFHSSLSQIHLVELNNTCGRIKWREIDEFV